MPRTCTRYELMSMALPAISRAFSASSGSAASSLGHSCVTVVAQVGQMNSRWSNFSRASSAKLLRAIARASSFVAALQGGNAAASFLGEGDDLYALVLQQIQQAHAQIGPYVIDHATGKKCCALPGFGCWLLAPFHNLRKALLRQQGHQTVLR